MPASYDAIIIGAGAAGLYCALHAGRRGKRVLVIEHNDHVGAKILISGGGRCNFTNRDAGDPKRYLSANPHFSRSALTRHTPADFVALIDAHGIAHYEKTLGQLFCEGAGAARKVVEALLAECAAGGVEIRTNTRVIDVTSAERFRLSTSAGVLEAEALVIASGGLSIPKLGANDIAFRVAEQFGVQMIAPRPGLAPLTFGADDLAWMKALSGVSTPAIVSCSGASFHEAALFTHRGLSGPAVLQVSSYWRSGDALTIDWAPECGNDFLVERKRARPKAQIKTALSEIFPERLASALASGWTAGETHPVQEIGAFKDQTLIEIARRLKAFAITPTGTEGYAKAEVTVGGVDTDALSQQTLGVKAVPGLFFIGECVDVTGWLGGYNFQWAWSSAWACAQAI